jgi:nucleotide-binding universal stress UspA family protein
MFQRILVAVTPDSQTDQVVQDAIGLAKLTHARLMLLHVLSPVDEGYPMPVYPIPDSAYYGIHEEAIKNYATQWQTYERQGIEFLKQLVNAAGSAEVLAELTQTVGEPGRAICALAATWDADLILLGRRGHKGLSELFLGSVSNYVLHYAPCSVLTIQGKTSAAVTPMQMECSVGV